MAKTTTAGADLTTLALESVRDLTPDAVDSFDGKGTSKLSDCLARFGKVDNQNITRTIRLRFWTRGTSYEALPAARVTQADLMRVASAGEAIILKEAEEIKARLKESAKVFARKRVGSTKLTAWITEVFARRD
jgi:hypothetical protein